MHIMLSTQLYTVFTLFFLLQLSDRSLGGSRPKCHLHELELCFDRLHKLKKPDLDPSYLLTTYDGLDQICGVIKEDFVGCIVSYIQKCGTPLHKELSKVISDAVLEHMVEICSKDSAFRNEIIDVGPCLHEKVFSQKDFQRECNNPFFTTIAWGEMNAHSKNHVRPMGDYLVETGCCSLRKWELCSFPRMTSMCTQKAQETLQLTLSKLLGTMPNLMCYQKSFDVGSEICSALPSLDEQRAQINMTKHDDQKFSVFSVMKMFLARDSS